MFTDYDEIAEKNFFYFVLKIFLLIGLNLFLSERVEKFNELSNIVLFNLGAIMVWFALWLRKTDRLYQRNLRKFPTTARSAETHESREIDERYRKMALSDACMGKETDMRESQW